MKHCELTCSSGMCWCDMRLGRRFHKRIAWVLDVSTNFSTSRWREILFVIIAFKGFYVEQCTRFLKKKHDKESCRKLCAIIIDETSYYTIEEPVPKAVSYRFQMLLVFRMTYFNISTVKIVFVQNGIRKTFFNLD